LLPERQGILPHKIKGGCFCGAVRYEADGPAFHETICHCTDCRRAVGSVSVAWFTVKRVDFRFTASQPAAFQSSPKVTRRFCATCGTSLTYEYADRMAELDLTIASLDQPETTPPKDHSQAADRLGWDKICDGLPEFLRFRP
jgi:hypothetical protein